MMNRKGFTLVELMIVVAIIGILASIAIPNFVDMQYRAKRAEIPSNVDGIKTSELAYEAAQDEYVSSGGIHPSLSSAPLNKQQRAWPSGTNFDTIGWSPDGNVRGSYLVNTISNTDFRVVGGSDIDGDSTLAFYTATKTTNAVLPPAGIYSTGRNVY
jgi:prepilin-type N-terminal cleavage/methylation domain-containing protein